MKRPLLFLALICTFFAPFAVHAQTLIPLPDLERLCIKNSSDFETFVLSKDYSIESKLSSDVTQIYASDKPNENGKKNMVSRTAIPHAAAKVEFMTTDKKWYLDLKAHMASSGYKFVNDEKKTIGKVQADMHNFTNGKCHVTVYSFTPDDITWYAVQVHL